MTLDAALERGWLVASGALLCVLLASGIQLGVHARRWQPAQLAGVPVYIAPRVGPAVVGLLRPRIVLPPWVQEADAGRQALVLAHERAHLKARDPLVLTIALGLLVFMPWNLPLWWQVRQLRRAIEVDCDARVLRAGHDVQCYGEALVEAGERQQGKVGAVAAMAEQRSFMKERLRIMLRVPGRWWTLSAAGLGGLSLCLLALAVQVSPPLSPEVSSDGAPYDNYLGAYQANGSIARILQHDGHLFMKLTSWNPETELLPLSRTEFFSKALQSDIAFTSGAQGHATALIVRQNVNQNINVPSLTWPWMDEASAQAFERALRARLRSQLPDPRSEAALRKHWASLVGGKPNYADMGAVLAQAVRMQLPQTLALAHQAGAIQSLRFIGVGFRGQDVYDFACEHENLSAELTMGADGRIEFMNLMLGPAPGRPPQPGSEAAIRKFWASLAAGKPDYPDMSPLLADAVRQQLPGSLALAQHLGAIRALRFRGVSKMGEDVYDALYDDGNILTWHVITDPDGKLTSSNMRLGPL